MKEALIWGVAGSITSSGRFLRLFVPYNYEK